MPLIKKFDLLKRLADVILSRLLGIGLLGIGFWLLYLAFLNSNAVKGVSGGFLILLGMWFISRFRKLLI